MDNVEALLNNVYYPLDSSYNSAYDGEYTIEGIKNIYYLVYDDKEEIKYITLGLIFSLATLSSLVFFSIFCSSDSERPPVQYKSLKKRKVRGMEEMNEMNENTEENKKKYTIEYC
jgi:hypothetical protein